MGSQNLHLTSCQLSPALLKTAWSALAFGSPQLEWNIFPPRNEWYVFGMILLYCCILTCNDHSVDDYDCSFRRSLLVVLGLYFQLTRTPLAVFSPDSHHSATTLRCASIRLIGTVWFGKLSFCKYNRALGTSPIYTRRYSDPAMRRRRSCRFHNPTMS